MKIVLFVLFAACEAFSQGTPISISYDSDLKDYEVLKGQIESFRVFFDGESHNVSSNETRHFNLFKYLYFNLGVRYFIKEYDFDIGFYVNKYIQTGDKEWLKFKIPSREAQEFYDQLATFNQSLPADKKIFFASVDAYSFKNTEKFMTDLTSDKGAPSGVVKDVVEKMKSIKRTDSKGLGMDIRGRDRDVILGQLKAIRQSVQANRKAFEEYFDRDYLFFHLAVFNHASERRDDENLATNFIEFAKLKDQGNYYLYYGSLHCQLKPSWFAGRLNAEGPFRSVVCSFTSQYRDSEYWMFGTRKEENFGIINAGGYRKSIINELVSKTAFDCTLFSTEDIEGLEKAGDYLFFMRNQKAMESYYEKVAPID